MKPIINIADAAVTSRLEHGNDFQVSMAELSDLVGGKKIGANLTTVPPGKAAFPFHHHFANEEHFYILRGTGVLRFGGETWPVKPGDYIVNPAGGPEVAHQLVNTGTGDLQYLAISTDLTPEVVGYPDSRKTGVRALPSGAPGAGRFVVSDARREQTGYWDDEDGAAVRALVQSAKKEP